MNRCLVYTRFDGGVSVYYPAPACLETMRIGGWWDQYEHSTVHAQVSRQIARGIPRWAAQRYFDAMGDGGLSADEAIAVLRDRDCLYLGTGHEIWHLTDIPQDRWFRNAWCRSHNGGPIYINMRVAQKMQLSRLHKLSLPRWDWWKRQVLAAENPDTLRAVWPKGQRYASR